MSANKFCKIKKDKEENIKAIFKSISVYSKNNKSVELKNIISEYGFIPIVKNLDGNFIVDKRLIKLFPDMFKGISYNDIDITYSEIKVLRSLGIESKKNFKELDYYVNLLWNNLQGDINTVFNSFKTVLTANFQIEINRLRDLKNRKAVVYLSDLLNKLNATQTVEEFLQVENAILSDVIEKFENDKLDLVTYSALNLAQHLELLNILFNWQNFLNKHIEIKGSVKKMLEDFLKGINKQLKEILNEDYSDFYEQLNDYQSKIAALEEQFLLDIVKKTPLLQDDYYKSWIKNIDIDSTLDDSNLFTHYITSIGSDSNVILQTLFIYQNHVKFSSYGNVASIIDDLLNSWNEIKDYPDKWKKLLVSYKNGVLPKFKDIFLFSDELFHVSKHLLYLNNIVNRNIEMEDKRFRAEINYIKKLIERKNTDFLKLHKLPEFSAFLKAMNYPELAKYIENHTDTSYKDELIKKYGITGYKIILEQAIDKFIPFLDSYKEGKEDLVLNNLINTEKLFNAIRNNASNEEIKDVIKEYYNFDINTLYFINDYIDKSLLNLFESDKNLLIFYMNSIKLLESYVNPILRSENIKIGYRSFVPEINTGLKTAISKYGLLKGIPKAMSILFHKYILSNISIPNKDEKQKKREFNRFMAHYSSYDFKTLIDAFGGDFVNEIFNNNIFEAIKSQAYFAANLKIRKELDNFVKIAKRTLLEKKNIGAYKKLTDWSRRNVLGQIRPSSNSLLSILEDRLYLVTEIKPNILKQAMADKVNSIIDEAKKRGSFRIDGERFLVYKGENGGFDIVTESQEIGGEYIEKHFESKDKESLKRYLEYKYFKTAGESVKKINIPSIIIGLAGMFTFKILGLNPFTGTRNFLFGQVNNMIMASSNRYGFNDMQLTKARSFLFLSNLKYKYFSKIFGETKKAKNIETFKLFTENFDIFQNKADEIASKSQTSRALLGSLGENFIYNFAIDDPEWHNQGAIILALMMNIKIPIHPDYREKYGGKTEYPLFDGENFIWEPGTLNLKPEFRTLENIVLWEKFDIPEFDESHLPENVKLHIKIKKAVYAGHGNYSTDDIPPIFNNIFGQIFMFFQRWKGEVYYANWRNQNIDLAQGRFMIGRKKAIFESIPTALFYISGLTVTKFLGTLLLYNTIGLNLLTIGAITAATYTAVEEIAMFTAVAYYQYRKGKLHLFKHWRDTVLLSQVALLRLFPTLVRTMTFHNLSGGIDKIKDIESNKVDKILDKYAEESNDYDAEEYLRDKDRLQAIIEAGQELAIRVVNHINQLIVLYSMTALFYALTKCPDNDEKCKKKKKKALALFEIILKELTLNFDSLKQEFINFDNLFLALKNSVINAPITNIGAKTLQSFSTIESLLLKQEKLGDKYMRVFIDNMFTPIPVSFRKIIDYQDAKKDEHVPYFYSTDSFTKYFILKYTDKIYSGAELSKQMLADFTNTYNDILDDVLSNKYGYIKTSEKRAVKRVLLNSVLKNENSDYTSSDVYSQNITWSEFLKGTDKQGLETAVGLLNLLDNGKKEDVKKLREYLDKSLSKYNQYQKGLISFNEYKDAYKEEIDDLIYKYIIKK